jgi:glycosyltransferase involved in cell wall biosynthesis
VFRVPVSHAHGSGVTRVAREYLGFTLLAGLKASRLAVRQRYDIVQVHNPPDFLLAAALVPRLRGARVILDVHDLATDMFEMRFEGRRGFALADRLLRAIERRAIRRTDAVLTVHEPYRQELISRGASPDDVTVILNTLDERVLPVDDEASPTTGFRVVYHGTITPHYGVQLLVEAGAKLVETVPTFRVELYGEGDALDGALQLARELGIGDRVVSVPHLPQREVLRAVRGASVGVVPNLPTRLNRFALSTKLFEYVALGIPVVCADLPTIRSYFSPDEVLFFRAGDARALADAVEAVAADPGAAAARATAARARYEDYTWAVNERRYVALLERLVTC